MVPCWRRVKKCCCVLCACSSAVACPAASIQCWESRARKQHSYVSTPRSSCCSSHSCSSNIIGPCWISHGSSPTLVTILLSNEPLPRCCLTCGCQTRQILDYSFSTWKRGAGCILWDSIWGVLESQLGRSTMPNELKLARQCRPLPASSLIFLLCPLLLFLRFTCQSGSVFWSLTHQLTWAYLR